MKAIVKTAITSLGLERPARLAWRNMRARGWTPWNSLVPQDEFSTCLKEALAKLRSLAPGEDIGDYLEFGVSRGTSMACAYKILQAEGLKNSRLIGFDSFEGMPLEADAQGWAPGDFHSTLSATRKYLMQNGVDINRVELVKGWFKDTLNSATASRLNITKASIIMVDCDIYTASKDALNFCIPFIKSHAILIFDDWGWRSDEGEIGQKEAYEEFLAGNPDISGEPLRSYIPQARIFLLSRG
jgi:O-methyltransferase